MSSRPVVLLLAIALAAFSIPSLAAAGDGEPGSEARQHGSRFLDRLHGFGLFPVGRGRIGVQIQPMTPELREFMGAPPDQGVLVERVVEDSPAQAAGLRVGDVIVSAGGQPVDAPLDLIRAVSSLDPDESLEIVRVREGQQGSVEVTPEPARERHGAFRGEWDVDCPLGAPGCRPGGVHPREELKRRLDEVEERLRELEKHVLPGLDNAETST